MKKQSNTFSKIIGKTICHFIVFLKVEASAILFHDFCRIPNPGKKSIKFHQLLKTNETDLLCK